MPESLHASSPVRGADLEHMVADVFRRAGWNVRQPHEADDRGIDLVVKKKGIGYAVEIKAASEGRGDRLVPLMAQAILQSQSYSIRLPKKLAPLAIVGAPRIPDAAVKQLQQFAHEHAPNVAIGVVDLEGLRAFSGPGLEGLNAARAVSAVARRRVDEPAVHLFSDLNQWMLKVLLARHLNDPERLHAPVGDYRNASELAQAAQVSLMSAFRFLRQLEREGFLHESRQVVRLVRIDELLRRWQAVNLRPVREVPALWILSGDRRAQLQRALAAYGELACVGLFAAAEALGLGFVHGAPVHVYLNEIHPSGLARMGLAEAPPGHAAHLFVRVPLARESVFRGAVEARGFLSCDVLQAWLDVSSHPARGKEQADHMFRRVIKPLIASVRNGA